RTQLLMILRDTFPFAEDLDVKEFASESYMIWMKESKIPKEYIPATLMSEGTIRVTALIVLLYFRQQPIVLIEEPERNIHPYLISKVAKMLVESSEDIQILATTHNPLIVKYVDPKDILLVKRNNKGFSEIIRPIEKDKIKQFLEHDMGLDELFVGNLLG
ncbi:MAG: ATP-binding protein, partial [Candidatus Thorarchaeota archaeon]|nr:ATP-binding protein [Candidatus Thorarchaeota archaeon]